MESQTTNHKLFSLNSFKFSMVFFALFGLNLNSAQAQDFCLTPSNSDNLYQYRGMDHLLPDYNTYNYCVKIYIHVIRKDNGTGGQSISNVNTAIGFLNMDFNPHGIYFNWDGNIDYINDTYKYYHPTSTVFSINNHTDGVDIYLFGDDSGGWNGMSTGGGQANGIGTLGSSFWVSGYHLSPVSLMLPTARSHVISHEMGHVLNLYHTHHGTVTETGDPGQCPELVNGSNSDICGDYITDTPADPKMNLNVDIYTCEWLGSGTDANGAPYDPDEMNIMSYTQPSCMDYITIGQRKRIKKALYFLPHLQELSSYYLYGNPCLAVDRDLVYYPNPANHNLYLDLREFQPNTYSYQIYNVSGELVKSGESSNELKSIDTSNLQEGHYYLHFYEEGISVPKIEHLYIQH